MKKKIKDKIAQALNRVPTVVPVQAREAAVEAVYTIEEVAELEKLSREFVRRRFLNEPGVRKWGNRWRIPHSVLIRVMQSQTV